jgi:hypothetical protein
MLRRLMFRYLRGDTIDSSDVKRSPAMNGCVQGLPAVETGKTREV